LTFYHARLDLTTARKTGGQQFDKG